MTYRVLHCGTGNAGTLALRGVIAHPDLELVGVLAYSPDKIGRDAGELSGGEPVGIARDGRPRCGALAGGRLPLLHGRRAEAPGGVGRGDVQVPGRGDQRRDHLGPGAGESRHRPPGSAGAGRGRVPGGRHDLLLQRRRSRFRQRSRPSDAARAHGRRRGGPDPGDHQLRLLRPGGDHAGAVRVRAAARLRGAALHERRVDGVLGRGDRARSRPSSG